MFLSIDSLSGEEQVILEEYCRNHFNSYNEKTNEDLSFLDFKSADYVK